MPCSPVGQGEFGSNRVGLQGPFDRFSEIFSTKGAEKRKQHGSKGSTVYRDPSESDRVWVIFDWDMDGFQSFASDPDTPAIMQEAGHKGKPQAAELSGQYYA